MHRKLMPKPIDGTATLKTDQWLRMRFTVKEVEAIVFAAKRKPGRSVAQFVREAVLRKVITQTSFLDSE